MSSTSSYIMGVYERMVILQMVYVYPKYVWYLYYKTFCLWCQLILLHGKMICRSGKLIYCLASYTGFIGSILSCAIHNFISRDKYIAFSVHRSLTSLTPTICPPCKLYNNNIQFYLNQTTYASDV